MIKRLIDMLIITVGQWGESGGDKEYEKTFESLLGQLEKAAGVTREKAIEMLFEAVEKNKTDCRFCNGTGAVKDVGEPLLYPLPCPVCKAEGDTRIETQKEAV